MVIFVIEMGLKRKIKDMNRPDRCDDNDYEI
jgi:hypothetical protein